MNSHDEDRIAERMSALLAAAQRESASVDLALLDRLRARSAEAFVEMAGRKAPRTWRYRIMHSRTIRWVAPAAAAVVAIVLGFWPGGGAARVYGMEDAARLLRKAKTLHIRGVISVQPEAPPEQQRKGIFELWADLLNGRQCVTQTAISPGPNAKELPMTKEVSDGEYRMVVNHNNKSVQFERLSDFQRKLLTRQAADNIFMQMFGRPDRSGALQKTGTQELEGVSYDVWEGVVMHEAALGMSMRIKSLLSPSTGKVGRVNVWVKTPQTQGKWVPSFEVDTIERDVAPPPRIFRTEPPAGYRSTNTKQNAKPMPLRPRRATYPRAELAVYFTFALPDGSLIVAWSSKPKSPTKPGVRMFRSPDGTLVPLLPERPASKPKSPAKSGARPPRRPAVPVRAQATPRTSGPGEKSQAGRFVGIEVGGSLPNLPVVIDRLGLALAPDTIAFVGRHLAFTKKRGGFYEWALYVPNKPSPIPAGVFYRANQKMDRKVSEISKNKMASIIDLSLIVDVAIDEDNFDTFVRGGMAELSDEGKAPDHVTYENVMQLARRIRKELLPKAPPKTPE